MDVCEIAGIKFLTCLNKQQARKANSSAFCIEKPEIFGKNIIFWECFLG